jgi:hypothetical protein
MEEILPFIEGRTQGSSVFFVVTFTDTFSQAAAGKISYTSDIWSSSNMTPYMAVTAHWIAIDMAGHLSLKCALIAFHKVWGKHNASNLATVMLNVMDRAGTTTKVSSFYSFIPGFLISIIKSGHFTLDNIETNTKCMEDLATLLKTREVPFDAKEQRIMCFPHIINIISQHVIAKMSRSLPPEHDDDDTDTDESHDNDDDDEGDNELAPPANFRRAIYARDPIARCRKIVVAIRSSGQRREKFEAWIKTGKL